MRLRSVLLLLLLPLTALEQVNDERFLDCVVQKEGYTQDHIVPTGSVPSMPSPTRSGRSTWASGPSPYAPCART